MSLAVTKRVLLTTVLTAAVAFSVNGQSNQQPAASDLELTLSTTTLLTCLGSSLPLKLEIRNQGTREMKIDKVDLLESIYLWLLRTGWFRTGRR